MYVLTAQKVPGVAYIFFFEYDKMNLYTLHGSPLFHSNAMVKVINSNY